PSGRRTPSSGRRRRAARPRPPRSCRRRCQRPCQGRVCGREPNGGMRQVTYPLPTSQERLMARAWLGQTTRYRSARTRHGSMDETDARLLELLQANSQRTNAELAAQVGLSPAAVHKRLRRLRESGVIERYTVLLDPHKLGLDLMCFVDVRFKHNM